MSFEITQTVGEIAAENPSSIRVFESLGIDYCCGGKRSLTDACTRVGVDAAHVLQLLADTKKAASAKNTTRWDEQPLRKLTGHIIETHHAYVRREIPRLEAMGAKISGKHGASKPEVVQIAELFSAMAQELSTHLMKEEQTLFPFIEEMEVAVERQLPIPTACFETVDRPIANLVADHDDAGAILERIRDLSSGYAAPIDACPTFRAYYQGLREFEQDLHQHVHLENNILFPRAVAMELSASPAHSF